MLIKTIKLWEDREDVELTTFLHLPDPFIKNPVKRPAVIVCPGGAYMTCPRHGNEGDPVAMTYAIDGYQSFVLEYSVSSKAPEGACMFPAQISDLAKAILTIRKHAQEWNIDVDHISLIGFSAGAHLCGMYATTWNNGLLEKEFGLESEIFKPLSAILIYGLFDYVLQEEFRKSAEKFVLPNDLNKPTFGTIDPEEDSLKKYSPTTHVSKDTPPIFLAAAIDDGMVPSMQSLIFAQRLHEKNVPYELHMFQYGDHGFSLGRNFFEPFREDKKRGAAQWVQLSKNFLLNQISKESRKKEESPFKDLS